MGTYFEIHVVSFRLSFDGTYKAVAYNDRSRSSCIQAPVQDVHTIYSAIQTFVTEMNKPENKIEIKLRPGKLSTP